MTEQKHLKSVQKSSYTQPIVVVGDIGTVGVEYDASEWQGMASEVSVSVFHKSQKGLGEVS